MNLLLVVLAVALCGIWLVLSDIRDILKGKEYDNES